MVKATRNRNRDAKGVKKTMTATSVESAGATLEADGLSDVSHTVVPDLVRAFKLLSDETRLRILLYLMQHNEMHVRALCDLLGQSQPAVSHHLALLREAEFIEPRRDGKHNYYRLVPQRFQELLDRVFATVPREERQIRFEDYVLRYAPPNKS